MLWQRTGGLQVQVRRTVEHLKRRGCDVRLFDALQDRLTDFDLIHVFSAINGTHRVIEEANAQGVKSVLTPLVHPDDGFLMRHRRKLVSWLTGKITVYQDRTTFNDILAGLNGSRHIVALSHREREALVKGFDQPSTKISVIPNGVDQHFFRAKPEAFRSKFNCPDKFVLIVGSVSPYKNQLGVIKATREAGWPIVLIGPSLDVKYTKRCLDEGQGRVKHLGVIAHDDQLLASAYSAAGVTVLASQGESFGLTAIESLAAGTPAVITEANGLGLHETPPILTYVPPYNQASLSNAISAAISSGASKDACRHLVRHLTWSSISAQLEDIYRNVIRT